MAEPDLKTVVEAAAYLRVSKSFVYDALADGRLKFHRLGKGQGGIRISQAQLDAFLQSTEVVGPAEEKPLKYLR